jgi:large subunit ribosomal protein L28e
MAATISHDLAWTVTKGHSATLVKRANGVQFSRDPLNLKNLYSRKNEGSIANKVRPP